jgi:ribonuclease HII
MLTRGQRDRVDRLLRAHAVAVRLEIIPTSEINDHGIGWANREAFRRLICQVEADEYVVDGNLCLQLPTRYGGLVRSQCNADETVPAVSAASIVAKVFRDTLMGELHRAHPMYGWSSNAGYGTREHVSALQCHGPCQHHRRDFVETALSHPYGVSSPGPRVSS